MAHYCLGVRNPKQAVPLLTAGGRSFPLSSIQAYNAGNIQYAGVLFDRREAVADVKFHDELTRQGFRCTPVTRPYEPILSGPMCNVVSFEELLGPAAAAELRNPALGD